MHAFARSVTVARSSAVQASSSRRQERKTAIVRGSPRSQSTDWASDVDVEMIAIGPMTRTVLDMEAEGARPR